MKKILSIQTKEGKTFNRFIFLFRILPVIVVMILLSLTVIGQTYTTIANGNWTSSSIWQGGIVPPTSGTISSGKIVNIKHTVSYNTNQNLYLYGTINIVPDAGTTARLNVPTNTNIEVYSGGQFIITNGSLVQFRFSGGGNSGTPLSGTFKNLGGVVEVTGGYVEIAQDWTNENGGQRIFINSCLLTGQNYSISGSSSDDYYENVSLSIGWHGSGNFQLSDATVEFQQFKVQLAGTSGNFQLSSGTAFGDIDYITMRNHITSYTQPGNIEASSSLNVLTGLNLDGYCATDPTKFFPYGKFSGSQTFNCTLTSTYFPGSCAPIGPSVSADLAITKTANPNPVTAGQNITYVLTVINNGPSNATGVAVQDVLPSQLALVSATPSTGSWSGSTWTIGNLNTGASVNITIVATVNAGYTGPIANTATVSASTPDPNMANNTSTANITVSPAANEADVAVFKTVTPNPVVTGQGVAYTILVSNLGPGTALNVVATDVFSTNLTFVGATPSPGTTWSAPNWTIGTLAMGSTVTLTVFATVQAGFTGVIPNTVTVNSTTPDPNLTNNTSQAPLTVTANTPVTNNYPATGPGTLAFEDLWPAKGDYDFNDLVIDYRFEIITNALNMVDQVKGTFTIKAFGASYHNGFGFQLSDAINPDDVTVTGYKLTQSYINLNSNGLEAGQSKPTIIVYDDAFSQMPHPGMGIGVNTEKTAPYVTPVTIQITMNFKPNTYTLNNLNISGFNPFIIVNQNRGVEVHLPNYLPTDLANLNGFGTLDDASNGALGKYYVTSANLPWAINIYESFDYPLEKVDITTAHLKFAPWATSGGQSFPEWYQDKPGYRNSSNIY